MSQINMSTVSELRKMAKENADRAIAFEKAADALESIVKPNGFRVELTPSPAPEHWAKVPQKGTTVYKIWKFLRDKGPKSRLEIKAGIKLGPNYLRSILTAGKQRGYFTHDGEKGGLWSVKE